jgi:hypothetical protein
MKKEFVFYLILIVAVGGLIYIQSNSGKAEDGEYTRVMDLKPFNRMYMNLDCPVYVARGDDPQIAIEGTIDQVNNIFLSWQDGELTVGLKRQNILSRLFGLPTTINEDVKIYIRIPQPSKIHASSTAHIITTEEIPGLESCNHTASDLTVPEYLFGTKDHPLPLLMRAMWKLSMEGLPGINLK